ncbi:YkvI family membrane protein [Corynebacterium frankenforstense]|uniref:YkvI family membrane protein n=1 Tax=Corynebacterium frankenforstense TaxID=1230998 RepID=UPI000B0EB5C5|nr:hypothetical protein [Corynebacterium frankenforstense]
MALVGLIVGAGFASGQEMLQYFVAFGSMGLWGLTIAAAIMVIGSVAMMQLGSYLLADEHTVVFSKVTHPILAWILDIATVATLFGVGFVMFAGGGSNLNQKFDLPLWVGTAIMLVLVLGAGMLDVNKVSAVIGTITPLSITFIVIATVYTFATADWDMAAHDAFARANLEPAMDWWWLSALNYVGFCLIVAVSMAIVIAGANADTRAAGWGGLVGGSTYAILLACSTLTLFLSVESVSGDDMPMLTVVDNIHPWLGNIMAIVIYLMVFNTAIGMFYAMAKRITRHHPQRFRPVFIVGTLIGFALGFLPFSDLVGVVYPTLGWAGIVLSFTLAIAWYRSRARISTEAKRRDRVRNLLRRKLDPNKKFGRRDEKHLRRAIRAAHADNETLVEAITEEVEAELDAEDEEAKEATLEAAAHESEEAAGPDAGSGPETAAAGSEAGAGTGPGSGSGGATAVRHPD